MFGFRSKRQIFKYHDGMRTRFADPIVVLRAIVSHAKLDPEVHFTQFESEDTNLQSEAGAILAEATRDIFGIRPFSEQCPNGLTELETLDVLYAFVDYAETLKKNGSGQQT